MLHLVGETIDKHRAKYGADTGKFVQIMRGIYVGREDDADVVLFDHALRVAAYLYPNTYLCGASAELLAPTPDRRLFLSGKRNARTRLGNLEIVQTRAPAAPETEPVQASDPMGVLTVLRSTLRFRYLESFRPRSEAGAAMSMEMQADIAERLVESAGSEETAIIECWRLAQTNGWQNVAVRAEAFITTPPREVSIPKTVLHVGWHGQEIGVLSHDGSAWRWEPGEPGGATPVRTGTPGSLPPFIESLLPEGWLERVLQPRSDQERITSGKRYTSNIIVSPDPGDFHALPADVLEGRLESYTDEGVFVGAYDGPSPSFDVTLEDRMAQLFESAATPRLSGVQIKAPMNLSRDGVLRPARDLAFTHVFKPSPGAGFEDLPLVEAACLAAAQACGFETAVHAIVRMPNGLPDALLVERFDIRQDRNDRRMIAVEDMASVRGVAPSEKYRGSIEQANRALRGVSSDPDADTAVLFARAAFAWLIADGDFHLKNMAVLRVAPGSGKNFISARISPAYDVVTTRVFPGLQNDYLALSLAGKRNNLSSGDLVRAATTMGLAAGAAEQLLASLCHCLSAHLGGIEPASDRVNRAFQIWESRIDALAV